MADRIELYTDGSSNGQTDSGGWAAIRPRHTSGQQTGTTNQEMELRAIVEAVKMAEGPTTSSAATRASSGSPTGG